MSSTSEEYSTVTTWKDTSVDGSGEVSIYATQHKWRGLDVFLNPGPRAPDGAVIFVVRVYALVPGGLRTFVTSGRMVVTTTARVVTFPPALAQQQWLAAARTQPVRLEVTLEVIHAGGFPPAGGDAVISIVASDSAAIAPERIGEATIAGVSTAGIVLAAFPELVSVYGVPLAGVAAARWLHVHDVLNVGVNPAGKTPLLSLPICGPNGAPAGGGKTPIGLRALSGAFVLVASSTAEASTVVNDCAIQAVHK